MHARAAHTAAKLAARREAALAAVRRPALDVSAGSRRLLAGAPAGFLQRLQVGTLGRTRAWRIWMSRRMCLSCAVLLAGHIAAVRGCVMTYGGPQVLGAGFIRNPRNPHPVSQPMAPPRMTRRGGGLRRRRPHRPVPHARRQPPRSAPAARASRAQPAACGGASRTSSCGAALLVSPTCAVLRNLTGCCNLSCCLGTACAWLHTPDVKREAAETASAQ